MKEHICPGMQDHMSVFTHGELNQLEAIVRKTGWTNERVSKDFGSIFWKVARRSKMSVT